MTDEDTTKLYIEVDIDLIARARRWIAMMRAQDLEARLTMSQMVEAALSEWLDKHGG